MTKMNLRIVTPERVVYESEINSLTCPTALGQITILPGHAALVATLKPGEILVKFNGNEFYMNVTGGFVQVERDNQVILLADAAEHHYEIDEDRALEAKARAEASLKQTQMSEEEYAQVAASLERSLARLNIARKRAHRKTPISGEGVFKE